MKELIDFMESNPRGYLATVDDEGKPHIRPWSFRFEQDGKLWFSTVNTKDVFCQLQCNPSIEFCSTSIDLITLRLRGEVIFGIDMNIKRKMLEKDDLLKSIYESPDNEEFEIFYLKHGRAIMFDSKGQRKYDLVF